MKQKKNLIAMFLVVVFTAGVLAGCGSSDKNSGGQTKESGNTSESGKAPQEGKLKNAHLTYYLWGSEGVANPDILAEINKKLKKDLNTTLEIKYIDWPDRKSVV